MKKSQLSRSPLMNNRATNRNSTHLLRGVPEKEANAVLNGFLPLYEQSATPNRRGLCP